MANRKTDSEISLEVEGLKTRFGALPDTHHVADLLKPNLDIVFCGTALGFVSAKAKAYYAHPGNFFWRTLHETGLTPTLIMPKDFASIAQFGLGLTDLCKTAYGQDTQLPVDAFDVDGLRAKIHRFKPAFLAFTSKTAAASFMGISTGKFPYGLQPKGYHDTQLFVLPSPSGQARIFWDKSHWQNLADLARKRPLPNK